MKKFFANKGNNASINVTIPEGFCYKEGTVDSGFIIENSTGDQYVLVPAGYTTEGMYVRDFWISRFEISKGDENVPRSVMGANPWVNINFYDARTVAESVGGSLISSEEYSRICMWLVQTQASDFESVYVNGKNNGNYSSTRKLTKTGSNSDWQHNHIYDFFGNGYIWTTEKSELYHHHHIIRSGHSCNDKNATCYPPANRTWAKPEEYSDITTFRIVLHCDTEVEEE